MQRTVYYSVHHEVGRKENAPKDEDAGSARRARADLVKSFSGFESVVASGGGDTPGVRSRPANGHKKSRRVGG